MGTTKQGRPVTAYQSGDCRLGHRGAIAVAIYWDEGARKRKVDLGTFATVEEEQQALDKFAEGRRIILAHQASHTCGSLWKLWLDERAKDNFSNKIYNANWVSLGPFFGHRVAAELVAQDFRDYARARFDLGRKPGTVHTELARLRSCLKWATDTRRLPHLVKVWMPSRGGGRNRALSYHEARAIYLQAGDPHIALFILLALTTGARHMAILDLTWDRVNWEAGTIQYDEQTDKNPMHKNYQKGRATVPFGPVLRGELQRAYRGRQTDFVIEHGGKRLQSVKEGFGNAVWRAGLEGISPHTLRHAVATWSKERGDDFHKIASLLGHSDSKTPELHYTHINPVVPATDGRGDRGRV